MNTQMVLDRCDSERANRRHWNVAFVIRRSHFTERTGNTSEVAGTRAYCRQVNKGDVKGKIYSVSTSLRTSLSLTRSRTCGVLHHLNEGNYCIHR